MPDPSPRPTPQTSPTLRTGTRPGAAPAASASFGDLLLRAGHHLDQARQLCATLPAEESAIGDAVAAHRDISSALALLGRVLAEPQHDAGRRAGSDAADPWRPVRALERLGAPRPWDQPAPATPPGTELHAAARSVRAAADLWTTHHDPAGAPRGPESSRVRHPAVLGAASRDWRGLVDASALIAEQLCVLVASHDLDPTLAHGVQQYPRTAGSDASPGPGPDHDRLGITVARPAVRRQHGPLAELADRLLAVRQMAWTMARAGSAPVVVLRNMAEIGVSLCRAADASAGPDRFAAARGPRGLTRPAATPGAGWREVAEIVSTLRSLHPVHHSVQVERMAIERILGQITARGSALPRAEVATALADAVQLYSQVAGFNREALRQAHMRGDMYIRASCIPGNAVARSNDALLHIKLSGVIAPAPAFTVRRLDRAYRSVTGGQDPVLGGPRAA